VESVATDSDGSMRAYCESTMPSRGFRRLLKLWLGSSPDRGS
jgi:hypothetical protein